MKIKIKRFLLANISLAGLSLFSVSVHAQAVTCDTTNNINPVLQNVTMLAENSCQYTYNLEAGTKSSQSISQAYFAIDCALTASGTGVTQGDCGEGATSGGIEWGIGMDKKILTVTPQPGPSLDPVVMTVNSCLQGEVGFAVKNGGSFDACATTGPIAVPVVEAEPVQTSFACHNLDHENLDGGTGQLFDLQASLRVERGADACITDLKVFTELNCPAGEGTTIDPSEVDEHFIYAGTLQAEECTESIEGNTGSPFLGYKLISGGTPYLFCFDLADGSLVALSNCGL